MSAFLGPVHFMLYNKIQRLVALTDNLLYIFESGSSSELSDSLQKQFGENERGSLDEVIDKTAIHNWLNNQVNIAESRFAFVVKYFVEHGEGNRLLDELYKDGEDAGLNCGDVITVQGLFQEINMYLLDGMPCDGGVIVQNNDEDEVVWDVNTEVHSLFSKVSGLDLDYFFELRDKWLQGFFSGHGTIEYTRLGMNSFKISAV